MKGMKTHDNLMSAFAGESQANRKYLAFAKVAEKEGHRLAAKMFLAAAEAETIHAHGHLKAAGGIGDTAANLKAAVSGETYEYTQMYPPFIEEAKAEGNDEAVRTFTYANEAEKVHAKLFQEVLDKLGTDDGDEFFVCTVCGHVHKGKEAPAECPICHSKSGAYKMV
jgi:rubrerythrin